jgi:phosphoribosylaminoimidazole (AIR) synthetase
MRKAKPKEPEVIDLEVYIAKQRFQEVVDAGLSSVSDLAKHFNLGYGIAFALMQQLQHDKLISLTDHKGQFTLL